MSVLRKDLNGLTAANIGGTTPRIPGSVGGILLSVATAWLSQDPGVLPPAHRLLEALIRTL